MADSVSRSAWSLTFHFDILNGRWSLRTLNFKPQAFALTGSTDRTRLRRPRLAETDAGTILFNDEYLMRICGKFSCHVAMILVFCFNCERYT